MLSTIGVVVTFAAFLIGVSIGYFFGPVYGNLKLEKVKNKLKKELNDSFEQSQIKSKFYAGHKLHPAIEKDLEKRYKKQDQLNDEGIGKIKRKYN